jgi:hypothetical protein
MALHPREILSSAVFALVAGAILWPPASELVYWDVFAAMGDAVVLLVLVGSVAVGFVFGALTGVSRRSFAVGGTLAYLIGMAGIEVALTTDSPVHFLLYGAILIGLCLGVVVAKAEPGNSIFTSNSFEA